MKVNKAIREQLDRGMTFFANNAAGVELAEVICDALACADQLRYVLVARRTCMPCGLPAPYRS